MLIGLTAGRVPTGAMTRAGTDERYVRALDCPCVLLPVITDFAYLPEMLAPLDAVLLTGGVDIHPSYYHENMSPYLGSYDFERDEFEMRLLEEAMKQGKPIFGICRGIQTINVYFGGSLYQDLSHEREGALMHNQPGPVGTWGHELYLSADSFLKGIYQDGDLVNSHHHQGIKKLGAHLKVAATAADGVIEAVSHDSYPLYAVQFHPEMLADKDIRARKFFTWLKSVIGG